MSSHSTTPFPPNFVPPMAEETVEKTSQRVQSSIRDIGIISRELLKGSHSEEALTSSAKQFANLEANIETTALQIAKIQLLSEQLALHGESIETALTNMDDLQNTLKKISALSSRTSDASQPPHS